MVILCTIDLETREVSLPAGQVIASYDHNVDVIRFQAEAIPGFSLDTSSIKIAAQGPNKARHDYAVDPATVSIEEETGYITFDWPIPQGVTEMPIGSGFKYGDKGQLIFAVCAEIISGSTVSKAWHSDDGIITVVAHLEPESGGGEDPSETATNAQKIAQLQTNVAVINTQVGALANGSPTPVETVAEMTDESAVYLYTGSETGYTAGNWYYYDGTDWVSGGTYGGAVTDTTLSVSGAPADAKAVGDALADKADADDLTALDTRVAAVEEYAGIFTSDVDESVQNWLDEHPEATTTVEDNSLTAKKLVVGTLGYITPEDYGAKGDGVTDDTQALQACVSAGNILHLKGTYKISAGIELHSGLHIYGFGKGRIVKDENTQTHFSALYHYDTAVSDILIDGLTIVGLKHWTGSSISGTANDYGIRIQNAENVKILHNSISECGACAVSVNGTECEISGNIVKYTGAFTGTIPNYNFGIAYGGENFVISDNIVSGVIQGIISGLTNRNVKIKGNDISTNGQHGMYMEGAENVIVSGNTIHNCSLCGIKFQRDGNATVFEDIAISNNIITDCGAQGVLIVALTASATDDIYDVVISGNSIKDCRPCINTTQVSRCVIVGNIITNTTETYGISINLCDDFTIASNRLYIAGADAIRFQNASDLSRSKNIKISDNYIFLSGTVSGANPACIGINTGSNLMIVNNLCIADADSPYISGCDGIKLTLNEEGTDKRYVIGNVAHGFRWDFRIVNNVNVVFVNNYYDRATGVPT